MKRILACLTLTQVLSAAPDIPTTPVSVADCYLRPDLSRPTARASPGLSGGTAGGSWSGSLTLRNETTQDIRVKGAIVHVMDGYGAPLFDIDPHCEVLIFCRKTTNLPLRADYFGGVSVFKFSCDLTLVGPEGKDQLVKVTAVDQAPIRKSQKMPGY
jgi:hypothetical protein